LIVFTTTSQVISWEDHLRIIYIVSQKKTALMLHTITSTDQPILIIFGRDVTETVCYQMVICYPTSSN